jgi:hypothetical protein
LSEPLLGAGSASHNGALVGWRYGYTS